jgi:hypothetical protein
MRWLMNLWREPWTLRELAVLEAAACALPKAKAGDADECVARRLAEFIEVAKTQAEHQDFAPIGAVRDCLDHRGETLPHGALISLIGSITGSMVSSAGTVLVI